MIEKTLEIPEISHDVLRITPDFLRSEHTIYYYPLQMVQEGNVFAVGEGSAVVKDFIEKVNKLFGLGDKMYYRTTDGKLVTFPATSGISGMGKVNCVFGYHDDRGRFKQFCATDEAILSFSGTTKYVVTEEFGGKAGVYHNERLFVAEGTTIHYSGAQFTDTFMVGDYDGGSFSVGGECGDIIALHSYARRLYAFCKHSIFRIRADASDLNFKIEPLPYCGEDILEGSVQNCGSCIAFMTEAGVYTFNGATAKRIFATDSVVFPKPIEAASFQGKYYVIANVPERKGGDILRIDPTDGSYYFITANATLIGACDDKLYYRRGDSIMQLGGKGFPAYSHDAGIIAEVELPDHDGEDYVIEAVTATGSGDFFLETYCDNAPEDLPLKAGVRARYSHAFRARRFKFVLYFADKDCVIRSLDLHLREAGSWK